MDKFQALQAFWSSFGLPAYDETTVPSGENKPAMPYITYGVSVSGFNRPVAMSASLWYRDPSWVRITGKLKEIEAVLADTKNVPFENGTIWIKPGDPFAQRMSDPDDTVRRYYINIKAEYTA